MSLRKGLLFVWLGQFVLTTAILSYQGRSKNCYRIAIKRVQKGAKSHIFSLHLRYLLKGHTFFLPHPFSNIRHIIGLQKAYRDRRRKKRLYTRQWIQQINAGSRECDVRYNNLIYQLYKGGCNAVVRIRLHLFETASFSCSFTLKHLQPPSYLRLLACTRQRPHLS